jgi:hypothetical protein
MSWGRYRAIVVVPPEPVVTPADVPGDHAADDATVTALIASATAEIDGPAGWLGRAIGPQTIELRMDDFWCWNSFDLPFPPAIGMVSVVYLDENEAEQTVDPADYGLAGQRLYARSTFSTPTIGPDLEGVRIRYRAGYDGGATGSPFGTTGDIPAPIRQWIILRAKQMVAASAADPLVRSEATVDLDSVTYRTADEITGSDFLSQQFLSNYKVFY